VDIVIASIGAVPNDTLAVQAGLAVENGITTDEFLRTSDPTILAAGDCASTIHPLFGNRRLRLESWRNAIEQGERAARNMLGEGISQETVPWFWSDQYDLCLQVTGLVDVAIRTVERRLGQDATLNLHLDDTGTLVAASGIGPLSLIAKDIRIAEMLIGRRIRPDQTLLSQPGYRLKSLLAA
jgi:3-phenylpropionate/trans-cinnamate dioxygenase ferredoxin reductase subunit